MSSSTRLRSVRLQSIIVLLLLLGCESTAYLVTVPVGGAPDQPPTVTINGIPFLPANTPGAEGEVAKPLVETQVSLATVSNVDTGTYLQLSTKAVNGVKPATEGGVKSLSFSLTAAGAPVFSRSETGTIDASGQAMNSLWIALTAGPSSPAIEHRVEVPLVARAVAENFNGQSVTLEVTYVPVDKAQRHHDLNEPAFPLPKVFGQNLYAAEFPPGPGPHATGTLRAIQGSGSSATVILLQAGATASECTDPAKTRTLAPFANLYPADIILLFGTEFPPLPVRLQGCANAAAGTPPQLALSVTYRLD